jgi:hypothetical protein
MGAMPDAAMAANRSGPAYCKGLNLSFPAVNGKGQSLPYQGRRIEILSACRRKPSQNLEAIRYACPARDPGGLDKGFRIIYQSIQIL